MGLGSQNYIMFMPDGSSQDTLGNYNSGVLYLTRPGDIYSSRAITLRPNRQSPRLAALQPGRKQVGAAMTQSNSPHASATAWLHIIETMIAIAIMSIGILTLVAAFAAAVDATQNAQENLIARQKALEAMESIYTARNTQQITFAQIANIPSGGIFTIGPTQMLRPVPTDW